MPEREWYEFEDPEVEGVSWRVDVTFLLSRWNCIYGRGCQGILEQPDAVQGCCSYGAYFADDEDRKRVEAAAARLSASQWQHRGRARQGIGRRKTPVVEGGCIFLNRAGFPGGSGCALHLAALEAGERPMDWKPDVCWQLPLRFREEEDRRYVIEEFGRACWGEGGQDLGWWCTEAPEAFGGRRPVYRTLEAELRKMMGDGAYTALSLYLDGRRRSALAHPAQRPKGPAVSAASAVSVSVSPRSRR